MRVLFHFLKRQSFSFVYLHTLRRVPEDHFRSAALVLIALPAAQSHLHFLLPGHHFSNAMGSAELSSRDPLDGPDAPLRPPPAWTEAISAGRALGLLHLEQVCLRGSRNT